MAVKFRPNRAGIKQLAASAGMVEMLGQVAQQGADLAEGYAPVDSGDYRDSIQGESGIENGEAIGRINAEDFKALWIEHGTGAPGPTEAFRPLGRALDGLSI